MSVFPIPVTKMPTVIILLVHILVGATKDFLVMELLAQVNWLLLIYIIEKYDCQYGFIGS